MIDDLRLRNYSPCTEKTYVYHVERFSKWLGRSPDKAGEEEIRKYLLWLREEKRSSQSDFKQAVGALRFFYKYTMNSEWLKDRIAYPRREKRLPEVLSQEEVRALLRCTKDPKTRVILECCYGAGLRLMEAVMLRVEDIDSKEMRLRVRSGKGGRERFAMLSPELLLTLRVYYKREHPQTWLFPGKRNEHVSTSVVQRAVSTAARRAGIKRKITPHTLRHSFATHLLENGTDIRLIQELMGHASLKSTLVYVHVSTRVFRQVRGTLDVLNEAA